MSRWTALGMIFAVMALVMTSFAFAPVASAEPGEASTTTTAPTTTAPTTTKAPPSSTPTTTTSEAPTTPPTTTTKAPVTTTTTAPKPTSDAPAATTPEKPTSEAPEPESTEPTTTAPAEQKRQAKAAGGVKEKIDVEITKILNDPVVDPTTQVQVGQTVRVEGTWDASNANPQPGDEFTIKFPDELKLAGIPAFALVGADETIWGSCTVVPTTNVMTCVLSDAVLERPEDVHGGFYVFAKAVEYTTTEDVEFVINGEVKQSVTLPGGGGIGDGQVIGEAKKKGELQPDKQAVRWTISIPGSDLMALDPGNTGSVTLTDTLSDNMKLCEEPRLNATLQSGRPKDLKPVTDGVAVTQAHPGPVSIAISNGSPFQKDHLYVIEYTSCTESGVVDPKGTPYSNSVAIGEGIGDGVTQDWEPETNPLKSGSIDKSKRYLEMAWTITVPGTFIAEKPDHKVTIAETLGDNHEVCTAGLNPTIWRSDYLPGPGGGGTRHSDVTSQFNVTNNAVAGAHGFEVTFTPKDIATFDAEKYYYVKFRTCVTGGKVPDNSDVFINTAVVNDKKVTASVSGPSFKGEKGGQLNEGPVTVAGEEQPAGTTVSWQVEIPGHDLEQVEEPAVISDTFSDTLTVCKVGGDLKANLKLKVIAKDFIGGAGAVTERDLTASTGVVRTADGVDFTLPREAGDYNRETRYFIDYTLCTSSGGLDERGTVYFNSIVYEGKELSKNVEQSWGGGGTGTGVSRGSFSLLKQISSESEKFPEGTEFTVKVEEFSPKQNPETDTPYDTYNIKVKADGTPVSGQNARGTGWTIRLSEIDLPTVDGVYFEPGKFQPAEGVVLSENDTVALVTITPKSNVGVKLVNRASLGTAKITKTVLNEEGAALTGNEAFVFKADIAYGDDNAGTETREFTLKDGQFYDLGDLPIGAKVTVTEVTPVNTDLVTWAEPVIEPKTLTIGTDASANAVSVTNEAKITQGTFELKKKLTGPEAYNPAVPASFDVLATWTGADGVQSKTLTLPSDGTAVPFGESLPGGTKVTLTEVVPADGNGLAWGVPAFSGNVTIGDDGAAVVTIGKDPGTVKVKNFVEKNDGTLRIVKQVSGEAAEAVGDDAKFTVEARWKDGVNYRTEELKVKQGESTPLGVNLPVGTEVTFKETGRPDVEGVEWGNITWGTDPSGESWLKDNGDGSVTGIVSDDPTEGRLITLTNEALWKFGSVEFTKYILDGDKPVPATEADLPKGAEFQVRIDGVDPALPEGTEFPAVGETITLNAANGFSWKSGEVLPRNTVVTFSEVDPNPLPGIDWARPYYWVAEDAGEAEYRNTVGIVPGENAAVEIRNRMIPTTNVDIDKIVTGPKGDKVMKDPSSTFQITATWTDVDDEARSCVLDVKPGGSVTPTAKCDASVIDGKVQFPLNTEINFVETGAHTDVTNVNWGEVVWGVKSGKADVAKLDGEPTGTTVKFTGDKNGSVVLGLENKSSSKGLIIIPIPIPLPPFGGDWGSLIPQVPGPDAPGVNPGPNDPGTGHNGAPGKPAPSKPNQSPSLPVTGANVIWLAGAALALIAGGTWLTLRNRRKLDSEE